ncbi:hypothetical protein PQO01_10825 [Lentisphaera marina]|uniref:hypothetical protein n=1 Tax=Lentisphaera marina TaxID=1111041 RepID=UPI00236502BC|nr:hypothetical protein [Lentisphaera marina]MDD7985443.1 hypothetical protein [Lentisphaera marina]
MKALQIGLAGLGVIIGILFIAALVVFDRGPETYVYKQNRIPKRFIQQIIELKLIDDSEQVKYFYSDGFINIDEGMYFITNKKIVLYSKDWHEPAENILFDDINELIVEYNKAWMDDSWVYVSTNDFDYEFPLSSERKGDKSFVKYLQSKLKEDVPVEIIHLSDEETNE